MTVLAEKRPPPTSTERSRLRRSKMTAGARTEYKQRYAKKRRLDLVKLLSPDGLCAHCGETFEHALLEVHHRAGITWDHNSINMTRRYARYWKEHASGIELDALCSPCNASDGARFRGTKRYAHATRAA